MNTVQCSRCGAHQFISMMPDGALTCRRCHSPLGSSMIALQLKFSATTRDQIDPELRIVLGSLLRKLRTRQGKTLCWTAGRAETHYSALSRLERGHQTASLNTLVRIMAALGVEGVYLLVRNELQEPRKPTA